MTIRPSTDKNARRPTQRALQECAEWLSRCVELGWAKHDLDALEEIWWKHHDDSGRIRDAS